jgi:hypothetical protein
MLDVRLIGMGVLASSALTLAAPLLPTTCGGAGGGASAFPVCGDGRKDPVEQCDGPTTPECAEYDSRRYIGGTVRCTSDCKFDTSRCTEPKCGDGKAQAWEECDAADLRGVTACDEKFYLGGVLRCGPNCYFDTSACISPVCGNGRREAYERCDGSDLGGKTCASYVPSGQERPVFQGGTLKCIRDCEFDVSECIPFVCGNGKIEGGEYCDGADVGSKNCTDFGYGSGKPGCNANCTFDPSVCPAPVCGNGRREGSEGCDGSEFAPLYAGKRCSEIRFGTTVAGADAYYAGGVPKCSVFCQVDTSECIIPPGCYYFASGPRSTIGPVCIP